MNIMNVSNLFNKKDTMLNKDTILPEKHKQLFSDILNKEKKNQVFKKQGSSDRSVNNEYNTNSSNITHTNSVDISDNPSNNQAEVSNKDSGKVSSNETKQLGVDEDIDTKESVEDLEDEILDPIISLLQSLLATIPTDSSEIKDETELNLKLSDLEMETLVDLKDQLSSLVDTMDVEADQSVGESIKTTLAMLTKIIDQSSLEDNNVISIEKGSVSELLSNIENLKSNIELTFNNVNSAKNNILQNFDMNKKNDLVNAEEDLSKDDTTVTNPINTNEEGNVKIKNSDKSLLEDNNQNFLKQQDGHENIIVNDNILASGQEKIDTTINVSVLKNEIVEPKQFISEIAQKASAFLSKDKNEMSIQLTPENLGKISIKIGLNDGTLTGKIYAENYSVKEIIEANLNQLRDALEESGLSIAGLEVNVGDNSQNFGDRLFQQRIAKKQNIKGTSMKISNDFITLEQDINQRNPYLVSGQFDGQI